MYWISIRTLWCDFWSHYSEEQSIVPAILLAWNMAKSLKINEKELHSSILWVDVIHNEKHHNFKSTYLWLHCTCKWFSVFIRSLLEGSYDQSKKLLAELTSAGIPIHWHGRVDNEPALYCNACSVIWTIALCHFIAFQCASFIVYFRKRCSTFCLWLRRKAYIMCIATNVLLSLRRDNSMWCCNRYADQQTLRNKLL